MLRLYDSACHFTTQNVLQATFANFSQLGTLADKAEESFKLSPTQLVSALANTKLLLVITYLYVIRVH